MEPAAAITNLQYIQQGNHADFVGRLKYYQYRDDKHNHVPQQDVDGNTVQRYVDCGLGSHYAAIHQRTADLATDTMRNPSKNVTARLLMLGPEPELMHAIPEDDRQAVLEEYTEAVVDRWFEAMDTPGQPDYSYVVHEAEPSDEMPGGEAKDVPQDKSYLHSHVVLAATTDNGLEREKYWVGKDEIRQLHETGRQEMKRIWTRELGEERVAELNQYLRDKQALIEEIEQSRETEVIEAVMDDLQSTGQQQGKAETVDHYQDAPGLSLDRLDIDQAETIDTPFDVTPSAPPDDLQPDIEPDPAPDTPPDDDIDFELTL